MKIDLSRHAPPGFRVQDEVKGFWGGCFGATAFSLITFISRFNDELDQLYHRNGSNRTLIPGAIMPDFVEIFDRSYWGFLVVIIVALALIGVHYAYHYQESKSIYTMRRLPSRWELHRRCLTLPLVAIAIYLIMAFVILLIFYTAYMKITPDVCLTPGQWQKIWSV